MDTNALMNVFQSGMTYVQPALSTVVGALLTTLFLRRNTAKEELQKLKAKRFDEAADILLKSGKMSYYEYYRWNNFASVAKLADSAEVWKTNSAPENSVAGFDFDWFIRFFDSAGNVSDTDMQQLWARVLAGEICNQGSFSLRTIETLRNMNQKEASLFERAASLVLSEKNGTKFIMCTSNDLGQDINEQYRIGKNEFILLEECGLISSLRNDNRISLSEPLPGVWNDHIILLFSYKRSDGVLNSYKYSSYTLTQTARQLLSIVDSTPNDNYILEIGRELSKKYSSNLQIKAHKIQNEDIADFKFVTDDLLA